MSVILVDLGDDEHDVMCSNARWRETLEALRRFGVLDDERLERLQTYWFGAQISEEEARAIGDVLLKGPLDGIRWSDNAYPPPSHWKDALGDKPRDFDPALYWPAWLRAFAGFCLTCKGFIVY